MEIALFLLYLLLSSPPFILVDFKKFCYKVWPLHFRKMQNKHFIWVIRLYIMQKFVSAGYITLICCIEHLLCAHLCMYKYISYMQKTLRQLFDAFSEYLMDICPPLKGCISLTVLFVGWVSGHSGAMKYKCCPTLFSLNTPPWRDCEYFCLCYCTIPYNIGTFVGLWQYYNM